jgi:membrane-associated phospholipid phosphatase
LCAATSPPSSRARIPLALAVALIASIATASDDVAADTRDHDLRWNPAVDWTILGTGVAALAVSELKKGDLAPTTCRWCEPDGFDLAAREALVWKAPATAGTASSAIAFGFAPVSALLTLSLAAAHEHVSASDVVKDAVLAGEATAIAVELDQLAKFAAGRQRPFAYALGPGERDHPADPDDDLSFFSGHTTLTFALAASVGTVATMRGYRWAPLTWTLGGTLAATTGYLRIAADRHWLTDVLTGAVVGTAVGILVPLVFHGRADDSPTSASAASQSAPVDAAMSFVW